MKLRIIKIALIVIAGSVFIAYMAWFIYNVIQIAPHL